jgi:hypothetical protein
VYYSTHKVFKSDVKSSQADFLYSSVLIKLTACLLACCTPPSYRNTPATYYSASQSLIATDGRSVSQSVSLGVEPHLRLVTIYLLPFDTYGLVFCGAPSLTRRWVCLLCMLLALASAVFLGPESLGTHNHILLSQI